MKRLIIFVATGAWSGLFPIVPGSVGTIPAWILAWFWLGKSPLTLALSAVIVTIIAVWSAGRAEQFLGHDSKQIVIDEWAGMLISLLLLPYRLDVFIAAFFFFRFYDVIKPFPAGYCETAWPGGWGVTFDDVVAGIYACVTCHICIAVATALHWFGF